jgi:hypothetical protein
MANLGTPSVEGMTGMAVHFRDYLDPGMREITSGKYGDQ